MTWTPDANGVYTFDVEFFNVEKMYTDFLIGFRHWMKKNLISKIYRRTPARETGKKEQEKEQLVLNGNTGNLHWKQKCMMTGLM